MKNDKIGEIYRRLISEQTKDKMWDSRDGFGHLVDLCGFKRNASGADSVTKYVGASDPDGSDWELGIEIMVAADPEDSSYHASVSFGASDTWIFDCTGPSPVAAYQALVNRLYILADKMKVL